MANRNDSQLAKKVQGADLSYLAQFEKDDNSLAGMQEYEIVPRLKILQGLSDTDLKKKFGEGSVIIRPGDALVWKDNDPPFLFVPLFFFAEFAKYSDRRDKQSPMTIARTFEPVSEIATRARDPQKRFEFYPDQEKKQDKDKWKYRYVEHLRFVGLIYGDHPLAGTRVVLSFEKGEFYQGKSFISGIKMRKRQADVTLDDGSVVKKNYPIPLYAQVWQFKASIRDKGENKWIGLDFSIPETPVVASHEVQEFHDLWNSLKGVFDQNRLRVDGDDNDDPDPDPAEVASVSGEKRF